MNYKEFFAKVEKDLGVSPIRIEKQKLNHAMLTDGGTACGPDLGHSLHNDTYVYTNPQGWSLVLIDGEWFKVPNGMFGWWQGENPWPLRFADVSKGYNLFSYTHDEE